MYRLPSSEGIPCPKHRNDDWAFTRHSHEAREGFSVGLEQLQVWSLQCQSISNAFAVAVVSLISRVRARLFHSFQSCTESLFTTKLSKVVQNLCLPRNCLKLYRTFCLPRNGAISGENYYGNLRGVIPMTASFEY